VKKSVAEALVVFPAFERTGSGAILVGLAEVCLGALLVSGWIAAQPGRKRMGIVLGAVTLLAALLVYGFVLVREWPAG